MLNNFFEKIKSDPLGMAKRHWKVIAGMLIAIIFLVNVMPAGRTSDPHEGHDHGVSDGTRRKGSSERKIKYWTCSMHPQIRLPQKGLCPLCAMDLIPVYEGEEDDEGAPEVSLTLNERARKLAEVETTEVRYGQVSHQVRLVGKVDYDETRLSFISAWVPGRIDRLFVDFTGTRVRKGDHLIKLYSPELLAAQQEYLQARKNLEDTRESQLGVIRDTAKTTLDSAREKLRLYGINEEQIEDIVRRGKTDEHMTIYSPVAGTVIQKNGFEGMYVKTGDKIYTIADLSRVWLFLDAYESDIQWLHYGQTVKVEAESFPGEVFEGKIAFIDPFVSESTRTIKLRVNIDNRGNKLKPGMFVRASIDAVVGEGGKVYEEDLAGKWICPMHPEIVKDQQEPCDICGMDLVKTSEFGFAEHPIDRRKALIIPRSAVLITGRRAVVYVENETKKDTTKRYEGREVVLGPLAGDHYIVSSGLKSGERVVTKGNFKIDSALQIQAKPSMMNPAGYYSEKDNIFDGGTGISVESAGMLSQAIPFYLEASTALAKDDPHAAAGHLEKFKMEIKEIDIELQDKKEGIAVEIRALSEVLQDIKHDLDPLRVQFAKVSDVLKNILENYEYREDRKLYLIFCSMAFNNRGGYWIQDSKEIMNPYFGSKMLRCGEVRNEYGREIEESRPVEGHEGH